MKWLTGKTFSIDKIIIHHVIKKSFYRTVVTMLASTAAITALAWLNVRPSLEEVITWVDVETLVLLFGMMVIVSVISETGDIFGKLPCP